MAFAVSTARAWPLSSVDHGPEHLNGPANTYYQTRPVMTMTSSLVTTHWGRVPSVHRTCYPVLAWPITVSCLRHAEFPVPPITLLTDMVPRCRLLAAHGLRSCLSVRTQPLTATGAPSQTSTMPCHALAVVRTRRLQRAPSDHCLSLSLQCLTARAIPMRFTFRAWGGGHAQGALPFSHVHPQCDLLPQMSVCRPCCRAC